MRIAAVIPGLLVVMLFGAAPALAQQTLYVSPVDSVGQPVNDLQPGEVAIFENGMPAQVEKVEAIAWPMKLTVLVDNGGGPRAMDGLPQMKNALRAFVAGLPEGIEISIYTIAPQPRPIVRATTDLKAALSGIDRIAPDAGGSAFVDALVEASDRIVRDKTDHFPVIMMVGINGPEGSSARERQYEQLQERVQSRGITVHVAMVSLGSGSGTGLGPQVPLGINLTKMSGGRYESIAAATRLTTLLPEYAAQIATSYSRQSHQYRVTFARPAGVSGALQGVSVGTTRQGVKLGVTRNGQMP